jgi:DNA-binding transcriptional ArsR family regulator
VKPKKVIRRLRAVEQTPEVLEQVARDLGFALARGERDAAAEVGRALAGAAPEGDGYWAGFAAGLGMLLASYEAGFERADARQAALGAASSATARAVIAVLASEPATGAELANHLGVTPGAASKVLSALRGAGLVRVLGGAPIPKRGARKPHGLTPLGTWVADELARRGDEDETESVQQLADAG